MIHSVLYNKWKDQWEAGLQTTSAKKMTNTIEQGEQVLQELQHHHLERTITKRKNLQQPDRLRQKGARHPKTTQEAPYQVPTKIEQTNCYLCFDEILKRICDILDTFFLLQIEISQKWKYELMKAKS